MPHGRRVGLSFSEGEFLIKGTFYPKHRAVSAGPAVPWQYSFLGNCDAYPLREHLHPPRKTPLSSVIFIRRPRRIFYAPKTLLVARFMEEFEYHP
jgi:hypothetical protein